MADKPFWILVLLGISFLLAACTPSSAGLQPALTLPADQTSTPPAALPGWNRLLPFDAIRPVYDPRFISASEANLQENELVMGVAWENQARAYPVTVLNSREMVNDEMAGIPYLVSW